MVILVPTYKKAVYFVIESPMTIGKEIFDMNGELSREGKTEVRYRKVGKIKRLRRVPRIGKLISLELLAKRKESKFGCKGKD